MVLIRSGRLIYEVLVEYVPHSDFLVELNLKDQLLLLVPDLQQILESVIVFLQIISHSH
jgi:hypothetical protein